MPSAHRDAAAQTSRDLDLGRAALGTGDLTAATIRLREALRAQPDLPEARESLARALYAMGDLDGAVEELRALLHGQPDAIRARYFLATALMAKQDWPAARRQLDEVVRRQPDLVDRKSTRLNSSHLGISYAVFCLKKKKTQTNE